MERCMNPAAEHVSYTLPSASCKKRSTDPKKSQLSMCILAEHFKQLPLFFQAHYMKWFILLRKFGFLVADGNASSFFPWYAHYTLIMSVLNEAAWIHWVVIVLVCNHPWIIIQNIFHHLNPLPKMWALLKYHSSRLKLWCVRNAYICFNAKSMKKALSCPPELRIPLFHLKCKDVIVRFI